MQTLAIYGNPSKRRKVRRNPKRRTAAQKAATARMLAANRARSGGRKRKAKRRSAPVASSAPRRVSRRSARRSARRVSRRFGSAMRSSGIVGSLKSGLVGGAGAVGVDIIMGQVAPMLPASMQTPVDAQTGGLSYGYVAAKAAIALALGHFGKRIAPRYAERAAEGALTVLAYGVLRPMVPASMTMGYLNPAPLARGGVRGVGVYNPGVRGVGVYNPGMNGMGGANVLPMPTGRGASAAQGMRMVTRARRMA